MKTFLHRPALRVCALACLMSTIPAAYAATILQEDFQGYTPNASLTSQSDWFAPSDHAGDIYVGTSGTNNFANNGSNPNTCANNQCVVMRRFDGTPNFLGRLELQFDALNISHNQYVSLANSTLTWPYYSSALWDYDGTKGWFFTAGTLSNPGSITFTGIHQTGTLRIIVDPTDGAFASGAIWGEVNGYSTVKYALNQAVFSGIDSVAIYSDYRNWMRGMYWDNLVVTSADPAPGNIPEPGSVVLMGIGWLALMLRRGRFS